MCYSKEMLSENTREKFCCFLWYFSSKLMSWGTTKSVLCCRELALRKLPPGRVRCSCFLSLCCCCSLVCGGGHSRNPEFMSYVRFHFARVFSRWTVIMTEKININLLSSLSLELREFFGPLCEILYRLRGLFCETFLVTKKKKSHFLRTKLTRS